MKEKIKIGIVNRLFYIIPIALTILALCFGCVFLGEADDAYLGLIARSYDFNNHSEYLVFINFLLGYAVRWLYLIIPSIDWFSVLYLFAINISFITIFKAFFDSVEVFSFDKVFAVIIIAGIFIYNLSHLGFTNISFMCCCSAIIWALSHIKKIDRKSLPHLLYVFFLFLFGFCMRNGMVLYSVLVVLVPVLFSLFLNKKFRVVSVIAVLIVCVSASQFATYSQKIYEHKYNYEQYVEFNIARADVIDSGKLDYNKNEAKLIDDNVTKNDFELFSDDYIIADNSVFSLEHVSDIAESRDLNDRYTLTVSDFFKSLIRKDLSSTLIFWFTIRFLILFIIIAIYAFVVYPKLRTNIILFAPLLFASEMYLFFRRRAVERVINPVAEIGIILILYFIINYEHLANEKILKSTINNTKKKMFLACLPILMICSMFSYMGSYTTRSPVDSEVLNYDYSEFSDNVIVTSAIDSHAFYDMHHSLLSSKHLTAPVYTVCGEWYIYSDYWDALLNKLELSEYNDCGIKSLIDDRVLFACDSTETLDRLVIYFKEHHNINVKYELVKEFDDSESALYKFVVI